MAKGTIVSAGNQRRVQVRTCAPGAFTEAKRQIYLDHLAACCNMTRAAAAAGVSTVTINYHRRNDPHFAALHDEALAVGYDNLEAMLIERAAGGARYVPGPHAASAPGPDGMDIELALRLLAMRGAPARRRTGRAGYEPRRASERELDAAILAKLEVLDRRIKREKEKARQKKGSPSTMMGPPSRCPGDSGAPSSGRTVVGQLAA
jgi:hypothetical protein